jgi:serine/threonine protein kinase
MAQPANPPRDSVSDSTTAAIYRLFSDAWRAGHSPSLQDTLQAVMPGYRHTLFPRLFEVEVQFRRRRGEVLSVDEYVQAFPDFEVEIRALLTHSSESLPKSCTSTVTLPAEEAAGDISVTLLPVDDAIVRVGRYELERMIGVGGFAVVWLARDPSLDRSVAIKMPRSDRVSLGSCQDILDEARRISRINLPGVVPVFDVVDEGERFYIVSQYMKGGTLAAKMKECRPTIKAACEYVATIAENLHCAHLKDVVHRDIKPSNILLDARDVAWIADFGLATSEAEQWKDCGTVLGTLRYMSPEQARGEGHLVDGRTDIYGLGMVFYELLTGRVAFLGDQPKELLEQIKKREPRPLRAIDDSIPPELERICLKCLSKDIGGRYRTAADLAGELRDWLDRPTVTTQQKSIGRRPWYGMLALGGFVLAVVILASWATFDWRNETGSSVHSPPTLTNEELLWIERLGRGPEELVWPGHRGASTASFRDEIRSFQVTCKSPRLYRLGTIDDHAGLISINLAQPEWIGGCGVFFGYKEVPVEGKLRAEFHAVVLQPVDDPQQGRRLQLRRGTFYVSPRDGYIYSLRELGSQDVVWPAADSLVKLELQLNSDGLTAGRWGRNEFSNIIETKIGAVVPRSSLNGPWGIVHERGTSWYQDPKVQHLTLSDSAR